MKIAGALAALIKTRFHALRADRVIKAMAHVIFACPGDFDRLANLFG